MSIVVNVVLSCMSVTEQKVWVFSLLYFPTVGSGGRGRGREDYLWGKPLDLKGRELRFHWLQDVSQEVDGARHACRQEVTR